MNDKRHQNKNKRKFKGNKYTKMCKNRKGHRHSRVTNQKGVSGGHFAQQFLTESPRGCKATHTWSGANPPLGIAPECLCFSPTE